jgi:hypothetical protein
LQGSESIHEGFRVRKDIPNREYQEAGEYETIAADPEARRAVMHLVCLFSGSAGGLRHDQAVALHISANFASASLAKAGTASSP